MARNALWLVLGQVATTALAIVLSAALGRSLGAADFGVYYLVTSISTFAFVLVDWGPSQVVRAVARNPVSIGILLGTTMALRLGMAAVFCGAATGVAWLLGYDALIIQLGAVLMAVTVPLNLSQAYGLVFRGTERMDLDAAITVAGKVLTVAFTLPVLILGGRLLGVILAQGAAATGALLLAAWLYRRRALAPLAFDSALGRELLWGGVPLLTMSLAIFGQGYVDAVILSKLASPAAVGWYAAARNFLGTLVVPATILASASYPRLSRLASEPDKFRAEVRGALRPVLGLGALAGAGTWLFADLAVSLVFGLEKFAPAADVLRLSAPVIFLFCIDMLLGTAIVAAGGERRLALAKIASVVVATALDLVLVPIAEVRFGNGGLGVVFSALGSELVMCGAALVLVARGTVNRQLLLDLLRAVTAGAGTVAAGYLLRAVHPAIGLPASMAVFAALALGTGLVGRADLDLLRTVLRRDRNPPLSRGGGPER